MQIAQMFFASFSTGVVALGFIYKPGDNFGKVFSFCRLALKTEGLTKNFSPESRTLYISPNTRPERAERLTCVWRVTGFCHRFIFCWRQMCIYFALILDRSLKCDISYRLKHQPILSSSVILRAVLLWIIYAF